MIRPIRILLADDQKLVRAGIRALLEKSPAMRIVGMAGDTREMLRLAKARKPDVVVMAAALPSDDGLQATVQLHQQPPPRIPVILLSEHTNGGLAQRAFKASASGYLLTKSKPAELSTAIRRVVKGHTYLDSSLARGRNTFGECEGRLRRHPVLSRRQRETLRLIGEGKNTKEIASLLKVSPKTVDFHRMQLMNRLKTWSLAGLVRDAIQLRLVKTGRLRHGAW